MNFFMQREKIMGVKHIVVVASGKGGVGKSTIAANLAITLAGKGYKTALVDADLYGPSVPKLFDLEEERISVVTTEAGEMMLPFEKYGVKMNSIGFIVDKTHAVIWRGPLAANALMQLFKNTEWGEIDYMVVDFPPGTGDIQISTLQQMQIDGAIVVTTPQILAVNDARKGAEMFSSESMNIPLFGVVENMSWFSPKSHPEEKYFLFGNGGGEKLAKEFNTSLLAQIPIVQEVGEIAEAGKNLMACENETIIEAFSIIADTIVDQISIRDSFPKTNLKIAVPTVDNCVDEHFGHCDHYTIYEIDENKFIVGEEIVPAGNGCGCKSGIATELQLRGVKVMLAGNMGDSAKEVLRISDIEVVRGCSGDARQAVIDFLHGKLVDSGVGCESHGEEHHCNHNH